MVRHRRPPPPTVPTLRPPPTPGTRAVSPSNRHPVRCRARAALEPGRGLPYAESRNGGAGGSQQSAVLPRVSCLAQHSPGGASLAWVRSATSLGAGLGPSGRTHSLGRRAAAAPWGPLALLQAKLATPARGCTGLIKTVRAESQEPALLLPGKATVPPPPPNTHLLFPSQPSSSPPSPLHSLCAERPGSLAPRARHGVEPRSWRAQFCLSRGRQVVIFRPPGVWREYPGCRSPGGHQNPQQNQASGRLACLCVNTSLIVTQDPPHLQGSKRAPLGLG